MAKNINPNVEVVEDLNYFKTMTITSKETTLQTGMFDQFNLKDETYDTLKATIDMLVLYKRYCVGTERKVVNLLISIMVDKLNYKTSAEKSKKNKEE